jgi:hypothetical protein
LRTGGKAASWRVAGVDAVGRAAGEAVNLAAVVASCRAGAGAVFFAPEGANDACGAVLCAVGRGLGNGTCCLAQAPPENADKPTASAKPVANAVVRKAAEWRAGFTAFPRGEIITR